MSETTATITTETVIETTNDPIATVLHLDPDESADNLPSDQCAGGLLTDLNGYGVGGAGTAVDESCFALASFSSLVVSGV